jgi:outer membrane protein assembly factor BamB
VLVAPFIHAGNWAQWRGPNGDGISGEKNVPTEWGTAKNVLWRTAIPGEGHSSPTVWEDSVFLTTVLKESRERLLLRLDARAGKVLWQRVIVTANLERMHRENSSASSTPLTDGQHVFTSFQNGRRVDLQCYDFDGQRVWSVQPLGFEGEHGYSYTPLLCDDLLIYDFAQNDEAAVLALDKKTGQTRWRFDRKTREISHVTPLLVTAGGTRQVVVCGSDEIRSFVPETGKSLWWCDGPTEVCVAGLSYGDGLVFATGGYPRRTRLAVKATGRGDASSSQVVWSLGREVSYVPSPVFHQGHLYTVVDDGMLYCFDARTGKAVWEQRLGGRFRCSLVLADGNIYATNDKGLTTVFKATSSGFQSVAVNDLQEFCYATPAISNGRIFLRTGGHLYCIGAAESAGQ